MSVELFEREFNTWASELENIEDSFETSRKKNIQVLKKKRDSIEKLKQKLQTNQNEPELTKLLAGMIKDYETKSESSFIKDKMYFEEIKRHELK